MRKVHSTWMVGIAALVLLAAGGAEAQIIDLTAQNTTGINCGGACTHSYDAQGSPNNVVLHINVGANTHITQIDWNDVVGMAAAQAATWGSEMVMGFSDSTGVGGVQLSPFVSVSAPCPMPAGCGPESGLGDLVDLGFDFYVGADGILQVEFFESFDDLADSIDAVFTAGTIVINQVPVELQAFSVE